MKDFLYKGRLDSLDIAFSYAVTTQLVNDAVLRHDCAPVSAHILGRALTAGVLMSATLNEGERVNIRWQYEGRLKTLLVDAGADQTVRGFVSPKDLAFDEKAEGVFGDVGKVTAVRSMGGKVLSHGTVEARLQNAVRDLAYFHSISDQVETGMSIMIGLRPDVRSPVRLCRGLMIQAMPGADLPRFDKVRTRLEDEEFRRLMSQASQADSHFESVINNLARAVVDAPRLTFGVCDTPRFACTCSREKIGAVLRLLPYDERIAMVKRKEGAAINCQFCGERYVLSIDDCIKAWNNMPLV